MQHAKQQGVGSWLRGLAASALILCGSTAMAVPVIFDFESLADSDSLTTQLSGLTVANATALQAGVSLNEFEFPPHSGSSVVFDDGGAMTIDFGGGGVASVGGYFNYTAALSFTAFDSANNVLTTFASSHANNTALSGEVGSSPNEFLSFAAAVGGPLIARLVVVGDPAGGSFTLDDLTVEGLLIINPTPEPAALLLVAAALSALAMSRRRGSRPFWRA